MTGYEMFGPLNRQCEVRARVSPAWCALRALGAPR